MTDEKVVVTLEARTQNYIQRLEDAKEAYDKHTQAAIRNSKDAQKFLEKSHKGQVKSTQRAQKSIERASKIQARAIESSAVFQAQVTEESTDRIIAALREQREAQNKTGDNAENIAKRIRSAFRALAGLGLTAAFAKIVKGSLESASEVKILADSAGLTTERFTEATFAAQRYGIEQEKLADIFKDVSDRVGDLVLNNGGPLKDFLESTGHAAGLTAESFVGLSSDQVLGLVVKTMEDAGQGGQELTNVLESLASDSVRLKPLLADNGKLFQTLAVEARAAGQVLNDETAEGAFNANAKLDQLFETLGVKVRNAIIEAAPEIEALTDRIVELMPQLLEWAGVAASVIGGLGEEIKKLTQSQAEFFESSPVEAARKLGDETFRLENTKNKLIEEIERSKNSKNPFADLGRFGLETELSQLDDTIKKNKELIFALEEKAKSLESTKIAAEQAATAEKLAAEQAAKAADIAQIAAEKKALEEARNSALAAKRAREQEALAKTTEARVEREIMAIEALGRNEREQIELVAKQRREAIEQSKRSEAEKAELIKTVREQEQKALDDIAKREADIKARAQAEADQRAQDDFDANQDRLGFIAEIEAATARMNGRAVDAIQIELDAARARYEEELRLIDELIAKKGSTPEREAERTQAQANLVGVDEDEQNFRKDTLDQIQGISGGEEKSGLAAELARLNEEQQAKIDLLTEFQSQDAEFERARQQELLEIQMEFDEKRKQARIASLKLQLDTAAQFANDIGASLRTAGLEGTKAAKIAAKAQQGIALGRATVNAALAISEAAASAPFPLNIPAIAFATATSGAQVAAIAAATFRDGGVNIKGPGTGTSDSIPARISRGESVITAAATRGNERGLQGLNDGLSPAQAFGLPAINIPTPNVSVPAFAPQSNSSFRGGDVIVQGNVDQDTFPQLQAALRERDRSFSRNVNKVMDARERRTQSRQNRVLGR